jgi:hypothetical protein
MKKALLTGIAALFLATGTANAAERSSTYSTTLPPDKYDVPYTRLLKMDNSITSYRILLQRREPGFLRMARKGL